jgi:hypothetical protein
LCRAVDIKGLLYIHHTPVSILRRRKNGIARRYTNLIHLLLYIVTKLPVISTDYECHVTYYEFAARDRELVISPQNKCTFTNWNNDVIFYVIKQFTVKVKVGCRHESLYFYYESLTVFSTNTFLLLLKFEEIIRQIHSEKKMKIKLASRFYCFEHTNSRSRL